MTESPVLSLGAVAARYNLPVWKIRRLYERGLLPEPTRIGCYRVVAVSDLPALEQALSAAGYLANATVEEPDR